MDGSVGAKHSGTTGKRAAACQVDMVYPPPVRPLDSAEGTKTRKEMVVSFRSLISQQDVGKLPVIVRCKRKWLPRNGLKTGAPPAALKHPSPVGRATIPRQRQALARPL